MCVLRVGCHFSTDPLDHIPRTATHTWGQIKTYDPEKLQSGFNVLENGERIFFVQAPALGLWAAKTRFQRTCSF